MRTDAQNVDLMGLAGFYSNCLGERGIQGVRRRIGREAIRMPQAEWKATHQQPPRPQAMDEIVAPRQAASAEG
jgi:hypothetical protein